MFFFCIYIFYMRGFMRKLIDCVKYYLIWIKNHWYSIENKMVDVIWVQISFNYVVIFYTSSCFIAYGHFMFILHSLHSLLLKNHKYIMLTLSYVNKYWILSNIGQYIQNLSFFRKFTCRCFLIFKICFHHSSSFNFPICFSIFHRIPLPSTFTTTVLFMNLLNSYTIDRMSQIPLSLMIDP